MPRLTILVVPAGVVLGHLAAYGLAHPHAAARDEALAGHAHFPSLALAALVLGVAALAWAAVSERRGQTIRIDAGRLAIWQLSIFIALEAGERVALSAGPAALLAEPAVWVGLAVQVGIAVLLARLVVWAPLLASALLAQAAALIRVPRSGIRTEASPSITPARPPNRGWPPRGPPIPLTSV